MIREIIGRYPAPDGREQMGRFLRYAFRIKLESFPELLRKLEEEERKEARH